MYVVTHHQITPSKKNVVFAASKTQKNVKLKMLNFIRTHCLRLCWCVLGNVCMSMTWCYRQNQFENRIVIRGWTRVKCLIKTNCLGDWFVERPIHTSSISSVFSDVRIWPSFWYTRKAWNFIFIFLNNAKHYSISIVFDPWRHDRFADE